MSESDMEDQPDQSGQGDLVKDGKGIGMNSRRALNFKTLFYKTSKGQAPRSHSIGQGMDVPVYTDGPTT